MANSSQHSDFGPALTGLVVGGCLLFALVFGIVVMTNHLYQHPSEVTAGTAK